MKILLPLLLLLSCLPIAFSQCTDWAGFQLAGEQFNNPAFGIAVSLKHDREGRPFVYLAAKDAGLKIYNTSLPGKPELVHTIPTERFGNLDALSLHQQGNRLYVALGDIWSGNQASGLAIIDLSKPASPSLLGYYAHPLPGGAGGVVVKEAVAYLAAMQNGLLILDISNPSDIRLLSQLKLDNGFPHSDQTNLKAYNARGIDIRHSIAFICYDRGGLRLVDVSDPRRPRQISQYCFPPLVDHATAYNQVVLHENLAFVSIDYYGMEILEVSDPQHIRQLGWWHPDSWAEATNNYSAWANSAGHANEIAYDPDCQRIYLSAGRSDAVAIDVSNPMQPLTCEIFGSTSDSYGTWGLDFFRKQLWISYIWSPVFPPFSNYTGFRQLLTPSCRISSNKRLPTFKPDIRLSNPFREQIRVDLKQTYADISLVLRDLHGRTVFRQHFAHSQVVQINLPELPPSSYFLTLILEGQSVSFPLIRW